LINLSTRKATRPEGAEAGRSVSERAFEPYGKTYAESGDEVIVAPLLASAW
jgi:hypothetical protein